MQHFPVKATDTLASEGLSTLIASVTQDGAPMGWCTCDSCACATVLRAQLL
jgi:hypothetical protein